MLRVRVQTIRATYQYVQVRTEYILFCLFLFYQFFFILKGYIPSTCWLWWSTYFWFLILLRASWAAQPVCLLAIQAQHHALKQITLKHWQVTQVYSLLLGSAWAPGHWRWRLAGRFSCGWSASPDSLPPWSAVCSPAAPAPASNTVRTANGRVNDLGFKLGRPWCAAILQSSSSEILSFREIKQRADLAWSWAVQMKMGTSTLSSD